jgi:hypothetical protein
MRWKDLKLSVKLSVGFGVVLVLLAGLAVWAVQGVQGIVRNAEEVIVGNEPHTHLHESAVSIGESYVDVDATLGSFLREKQTDHLAWKGDVAEDAGKLLEALVPDIKRTSEHGRIGKGR